MIAAFEWSAFVVFVAAVSYLLRFGDRSWAIVGIVAMFSILAGEWLNAQRGTTVYHSDFVIWLPALRLPLAILCAGVLLAWLAFAVVARLLAKHSERFYLVFPVTFLLGTLMPFNERLWMSLGIWQWNRPSELTISWYLGVYIYYLLFVLVAVVPAWWLRCRHRSAVDAA